MAVRDPRLRVLRLSATRAGSRADRGTGGSAAARDRGARYDLQDPPGGRGADVAAVHRGARCGVRPAHGPLSSRGRQATSRACTARAGLADRRITGRAGLYVARCIVARRLTGSTRPRAATPPCWPGRRHQTRCANIDIVRAASRRNIVHGTLARAHKGCAFAGIARDAHRALP